MFRLRNIFMSNLETEAKAFNYYTLIEENGVAGLHPDLYYEYLSLLQQLTGKVIPYRKGCSNRIKKAQHFFSDYFKNK